MSSSFPVNHVWLRVLVMPPFENYAKRGWPKFSKEGNSNSMCTSLEAQCHRFHAPRTNQHPHSFRREALLTHGAKRGWPETMTTLWFESKNITKKTLQQPCVSYGASYNFQYTVACPSRFSYLIKDEKDIHIAHLIWNRQGHKCSRIWKLSSNFTLMQCIKIVLRFFGLRYIGDDFF
jgi:hypothetical protein